jgi:acyl-CoA carboxylase subunit beta
MRAGPLSDPEVAQLLNQYFVPVYVSNEDYGETPQVSAEEDAERTRIFRQGHQLGLSVGTVHVYLLDPDGDGSGAAEAQRHPVDELHGVLGPLLSWPGAARPVPVESPEGERVPVEDAWTEVQRARARDRPRAGDYLANMDVAFELRGDRSGGDDPSVRVCCVRISGRPAVVVAVDRRREEGRVTPGGYRKAWRGLRLADRLGVPLVTLVDTPGADASASSEAGGIAHHIARTFHEMLAVRSPVVALVVGEGGSGGALALSIGDRLLVQEHAVFSVIAPEGAAAILYRDPGRAAEVAALLKLSARDLARLRMADEVVPEPAGAVVAAGLEAVARHLDELGEFAAEDRLAGGAERWRTAAGLVPA